MTTVPLKIDVYTERLSVSLVIATLLHLIPIYGITFILPQSNRPPNPTLDIILVQKSTTLSPEIPDYLAQFSQEGGGESHSQQRPSTPTIAPFPDNRSEITMAPPNLQIAASSENPSISYLTTPNSSPLSVNPTLSPAPILEKNLKQGEMEHTLPIAEEIPIETIIQNMLTSLTSRQTELNERFEFFAKRERRKFINADTQESIYAIYMDNWRRKTEAIANLNYKALGQPITGTLTLDVAIYWNGTLEDVNLIKSSGQTLLDDIAIRSVRNSAPYPSFSEPIRKETDIIHITRTWEFRYGKVTSH